MAVSGGGFYPELLDFTALFGRDAPVTLEIGFGMGASLVEMAKQNPDKTIWVLKCMPRVGACLADAQEAG